VRVGEVANEAMQRYGKPLDGIRVLALEQMQALPFATQLLGRLGADVVKVEAPGSGDSGRASLPAMTDPAGHLVGATFLRNNLTKRSVTIDLKQPAGRDLVLRLAPRFDVFAENFRSGALAQLGLGYDDVAAVHPRGVYLSISGFGNTTTTPYATWPAYAAVAEAMSGIYEFKRSGDLPPVVAPVGGLGDIGTALFAAIGVLCALRHREHTGEGQYVDVAMLDAMVSMTDVVTNFWSMGLRGGDLGGVIMNGFRARDGWFILQVVRDHQFAALAKLVGRPEWPADARFATRQGWADHLDSDIRPALEAWASTRTKLQACRELSEAGLAAGPCFSDEEVVHDPHVAARNMLVSLPRTDGIEQPVLIPGNPVKLSKMAEGPERRVPWLGEHTDEVLATELGLSGDELGDLRAAAVIT
jgi:crotonobetainyl-CoA:carnitine CoA-transferase CaiB-like acyl-CoA transferase